MKVAIVYDYIPEWNGGGERTLLEIIKHFAPNADFYSAFTVDSNFSRDFIQEIKSLLPNRTVHTGPIIKHLKPITFRIQNFLLPSSLGALQLRDYDLVISYTAFLAHTINPPKGKHILYMNTPARFLWNLGHSESLIKKMTSPFLITDIMRYRSKLYDLSAINQITHFYTISKAVKKRIQTFYNKSARVIYPPSIDDKLISEDFTNENLTREFGEYLIHVSRIESYKNIQLIIDTVAGDKINRNIIIVGDGPYLKTLLKYTEKKLKTRGKNYISKAFQRSFIKINNIYFAKLTPDREKWQLLSSAYAFLSLNNEDFGISKVESLAMGTSIIGLNAGATPELIINNQNGVLFKESTVESLSEAITKLTTLKFSREKIKNTAYPFTVSAFHNKLEKITGA